MRNRLPMSAAAMTAHDRAIDLLGVIRIRNTRLKQAGLRDLVCPPDAWEILLVLFCAERPMSLGEIAAEFDAPPRLLSRWVDALVACHLATRDDETDRAALSRFGMGIVEETLAPQ